MVSDSNDCMATASYTLFAFDTIFVDQHQILCEGESFFFNGETFSADTSFCVAFNSINGCDSVHCVDLQFLDTVLVQEGQTLCFGESLTIDGMVLDTDTTACFVYTGANRCDSTYCITLSISGGITSLSDEICEGDNYDFAGMLLSGTGIYYDTLQNQNGCDSILALNLMVHPLPQISFNTIGSLCNDTEVEISAPGFSSYNWSTGSAAPGILINTPGNYSLTVSDQNNCENTASIDITDEGIQEVYFSSIAPSCFGEMDGEILIDSIIGGNPPYLYAINNQVFQQSNIFNNLAAGSYEVVIEDAEGCTYNLNTNLNQPQEIIADLGPDQTMTLGDSINLSIITNTIPTKIEWSPSELVACDTCLSTSVRPFESSTITVEITDAMGCTTTDIVQISVDRKGGIYIPNAFSPNGDGINDEFRIYTNESVSRVISFQVFNRWGGLVHEVKDKAPNDPGIAWDGNFLGKTAQAGVYIFSLEVERIDQHVEIINGATVLLK
jgi:gliding motility-associated-like protein